MQIPMTEINFMYLHREIVTTLSFKKEIRQTLRILKLNTVVVPPSGGSAGELEGNIDDGATVVPSTSAISATIRATPSKRRKRSGTTVVATGGSVLNNVVLNPSLNRLSHLVDVGTQTEVFDEDESEEEEEEDPIAIENYKEIKRKYMDNKIRAEEFNCDLEEKE